MAKRRLTAQQLTYLRMVNEMIKRNGYPPTLRELGQELGGVPVSTVYGCLDRLRKRGLVAWESKRTRTLRLTEEGRRVVEEETISA